jgi:hypothetical protein
MSNNPVRNARVRAFAVMHLDNDSNGEGYEAVELTQLTPNIILQLSRAHCTRNKELEQPRIDAQCPSVNVILNSQWF